MIIFQTLSQNLYMKKVCLEGSHLLLQEGMSFREVRADLLLHCVLFFTATNTLIILL